MRTFFLRLWTDEDAFRAAAFGLGRFGVLAVAALLYVGVIPTGSRMWVSQYMYSLGIATAGGTANIQRNVIGERGLGLPRDTFADRSPGK